MAERKQRHRGRIDRRGRDRAQTTEPAHRLSSLPQQIAAALRNAIDIARMGRLEQAARTPYDVALRRPTFRLRRYAPTGAAAERAAGAMRPPIVLVPPLMITAEVYDIAPGGSAVALLLEHDLDPWVVDFGAPERQEGGLQRTLTDHVLAVSEAVDHVAATADRPVHLAGYSQGGIFVYLAAAYRRSRGLASLVTFGTPVNVHRQLLPGVPDAVLVPLVEALGPVLSLSFARRAVPAWLSRTTFRVLSPVKEVQRQLEFLRSLHDRDALARKEGQRRFLADEGWVAWPGPAFRDFVEQMLMGNRLMGNRLFSGGFVVEGRALTLADVTCPILVFVGEHDDIARPPTVRSLADAAPRAELWEATIAAGHMGLVVGSRALRETWPTVAAWVRWREGGGPRPERIAPLAEAPSPAAAPRGAARPGAPGALPGPLELAGELGRGALSMLLETAAEGVEAMVALGVNLGRQLPRLARLEALRRDTRIGLALLLAEQAAASPQGTFFLYEGRAHTFAAADRRVDAIVRGLLEIGVRTGDHVGVLMHTRPTALALIAAINRLGAVAVLLRLDGDLAAELRAGGVQHLIADPDHAELAVAVWESTTFVLGGVNAPGRRLPPGAVDMERIDPERVAVPEWYEPSPGRSEDLAFVFFAGRGETLRVNRVTNRRWALSAFGTASAAALSPADTVYAWTSIQHPTGLLVSMSGALAGGARLAMAQGFSASRFWDEVRRYGATVVFYAGIVLRELVDAPRDPAERKHPVRMFAGSGMPRPLWQRLVDRFGPVDVLEFYASTEGNAILGNVSGRKIGSVGRPLPGSAEVRLAAWDLEGNVPIFDASGYVRRADPGGVGMLLARTERTLSDPRPLRNVFARGDAWLVTGGVFRRDADGDYWLVDQVADFLHTRHGVLPSLPIEEAVWELPAVSAAAGYGLRLDGMRSEVPAVTVLLRDGATLDLDGLARVVAEKLPPASRPLLVRVATDLPLTAGYRVLKAPLRTRGIAPADLAEGRVFAWDAEGERYVALDAAAWDAMLDAWRRSEADAVARR